MPVAFTCPSCGRSGRLPESFTGDRVKCPACQAISLVSAAVREVHTLAAPPPAPPSPAPRSRPAPPAPAPAPAGSRTGIYIAGGVGAGIVLLGVGLVFLFKGKDADPPLPQGPAAAIAPAAPVPGGEADAPAIEPARALRDGRGNPTPALSRLLGPGAVESAPVDVRPPAPSSSPPATVEDKAETVRRIKDATVFLKVRAGNVQASGSGFVIKDEGGSLLVATNHHVVTPHLDGPDDANDPQKARINPVVTAVFRSGAGPGVEQSLPAQVIASDREGNRDLAILRVRGLRNPPRPIEIARGSEPFETMPVLIYGFPFGDINRMLDGSSQGNPAITINRGSVSSLRRDPFGQVAHVQIDGSINPGNSGGPVVDESGRLVGVSVAQIRNTTIGFAVPPGELSRMLDGRIGRVGLALRSESNGLADLQVEARLIDPLSRIRGVELLFSAARNARMTMNPGPDGAWPPLPGASRVSLSLSGPTASGLIQHNIRGASGRRLMVQVAYKDSEGRTVYTHPEPFDVPARPSAMSAVGAPRAPSAAAGPRPSFAALGPLIDPTNTCKLDRGEARFTLDVPAGVHMLSDDLDIKNAPMILADVGGDFVAQVKVGGAMIPGTDPAKYKAKTMPYTFEGAGLVLWQDKDNYLRLERSAKGIRGRVTLQTEVLVEICKNGRPAGHVYAPIPAGPLHVRIARIEGNLYCMFGPDGKQWISLKSLAVSFPDKVQIGLCASNASKELLSTRFEDFVLITEKKAVDEANQP